VYSGHTESNSMITVSNEVKQWAACR